MEEITTQVEKFQICKNPDHWQNMIVDGKCFTCESEFAECKKCGGLGYTIEEMPNADQTGMTQWKAKCECQLDKGDETPESVDSVIGVGDGPQNKHE